jgi:phage anti-repressor protein/very-short-patch-repair endonuclease
MIELIKISQAKIGDEEQHVVSARDLHKKLGVKKDFSDWIKDQIKRGAFEENLDFVVVWSDPLKEDSAFLSETEMLNQFKSRQRAVASGYQSDYILTLVTATNIVRVITHNPNTGAIYEFLKKQQGTEIFLVARKRKELEFFTQLKETLEAMYICVETQSSILTYTVDGFIREVNLVIEFDEAYHNTLTQQIKDKDRMDEVIDYTQGNFLRLHGKYSNNVNIGKVMQKICSIRLSNQLVQS